MSEQKRETIFADGMMFRKPNENAPEFVKGEISIKVDEFIAFLQKHKKADGWVNLNLKKSTGGKLYIDLNNWTPPKKDNESVPPTGPKSAANTMPDFPEEEINPEDIPF